MASPAAWQQLPGQGSPSQGHWQAGQMQRAVFPGYPAPPLQPYRAPNQLNSTPPGASSPNLPLYQPPSPSGQMGSSPTNGTGYAHVRWDASAPPPSIFGARPTSQPASSPLVQPPPYPSNHQWILPGQHPQRPFLYPPTFSLPYQRQELHPSFRPVGDPFQGGAAFGVWGGSGIDISGSAAHHELPDFHAHKMPAAAAATGEDKSHTAVSDSKSENAFPFEVSEEDAWAAHKTEDGVIYYYNSVTGDSTYEKPAGFKGEAGNVTSQPTPVSCEKLSGTDWSLVTTNDGKKYYYNPKTQATSWQIPAEIVDKGKKDVSNAPAALTGGREAKGTSNTPTALDTIKKKLQEYSGGIATVSEPEVAKAGADDTSKDKSKENAEASTSDSSSDSEEDGPTVTKEERVRQFKEMLKEKGVAPFSKWEKELPKILFDPRFKAIAGHTERRSIFEHYVRTRAEEERKEKRAAQKLAVEGFKQLLDEANSSNEFSASTTYENFASIWNQDPRFEALDRKERETLLNERILPLKKAEEERAKAAYASVSSEFQAMLKERNDITSTTRWSKIKDLVRHDPRCKAVRHEDRENIFNSYIAELRAAEQVVERAAKEKRDEENKLRERERVMRKRKERTEQELDRVRAKARRKDAVTGYQALLTEKIKDAEASWTESKPKLEKDALGRATNPELDAADRERLFRDHVKDLYERCEKEYRALLAEAITLDAASKLAEDGKDILGVWSDAKDMLNSDHRYNRMPRRARETWWHRHAQELQRRLKPNDRDKEKDDPKARASGSSSKRQR
ncbi:pre-mRNA-processing protein 40C [Selaginella moellendorffii]|uniref:pre-mRNA-processing protein 40C n=1 Tax=Selaginella moellendorffii TaxID=88036 RepID=UPI000D1C3ED4|nr:pre-mRNA-processing protein 40C [Selaginella moellendorffii]|eukprot:XP_024526718.1 pre-mRNA-processing protein 40C [Selaginella moellendorffii]